MPNQTHKLGGRILAEFFYVLAQAARILSSPRWSVFWNSKAIALSPNEARISGLLGHELARLGQVQDARKYLIASMTAHIRTGADLIATADGLLILGEAKLCAETLSRAVQNADDNISVYIRALKQLARYRHSASEARPLFERAKKLAPNHRELASISARLWPESQDISESIRTIVFGTTGTCNASCLHCPTGKPQTDHVPRFPLSMDLFEKVIDEVKERDIRILEGVNFGLFGDGLVDPLVVERARYLKKRLPSTSLHVNTNGAAYNRKKHAVLRRYVSSINVHCESLRAERYNFLMAPLRLERVWPKIKMLVEDFPKKVSVSVPISRINHDEQQEIQDTLLSMGVRHVFFAPLSARCADDQSDFNRMAFSPRQIECNPDILRDLIIDCDGTVLACCQDFSRKVPIGNLAEGSITDLSDDPRYQEMQRQLQEKRHAEVATCSRCRADTEIPAKLAL